MNSLVNLRRHTVQVFHNNTFREAATVGYQPASYTVGDVEMPPHTVTEVYRYTPHDSGHTLESVFELFNVGHDPDFVNPPDPRALDYHDRANRSLSTGDVVGIKDQHGARFYACASIGWDLLDQPPTIDNRELPGTTPVDAELVAYALRFTAPPELAAADAWQIPAYSRGQLAHRIHARLTEHLALDPTSAQEMVIDHRHTTRWRAVQRRHGTVPFDRTSADAQLADFIVEPPPGNQQNETDGTSSRASGSDTTPPH